MNDRVFPNTMTKLVADLESKQILTDSQAQKVNTKLRIYRHTLSHLEFAAMFPPMPWKLREIAELINRMFSSVKRQTARP